MDAAALYQMTAATTVAAMRIMAAEVQKGIFLPAKLDSMKALTAGVLLVALE